MNIQKSHDVAQENSRYRNHLWDSWALWTTVDQIIRGFPLYLPVQSTDISAWDDPFLNPFHEYWHTSFYKIRNNFPHQLLDQPDAKNIILPIISAVESWKISPVQWIEWLLNYIKEHTSDKNDSVNDPFSINSLSYYIWLDIEAIKNLSHRVDKRRILEVWGKLPASIRKDMVRYSFEASLPNSSTDPITNPFHFQWFETITRQYNHMCELDFQWILPIYNKVWKGEILPGEGLIQLFEQERK